MKDVKRIAASKRRRILIILSAVVVVLLAIAVAYVMDYVNTTVYEDPADEAKYYIRLKDGEYKMYSQNKKDVLPMTDDGEYYITDAGTLVSVDSETGTYLTMAVVDTDYNEVAVNDTNLLALPYCKMENIRSIELHNEKGSFTLHRYNYGTDMIDDTCDFTIKGFPLVTVDQIGVSSICVAAGRLLTTRKFVSPDALTDEQKAEPEKYEGLTYITNEDGTLDKSEYGLVAETRTRINKETGELEEYEYEPAYFIVTSTADENGKSSKYKVIVGDELVTGNGYYIQIADYNGEGARDVVYIATASLGVSVFERVESYAVATLSYPMTMTTYLDVKNFVISEKGSDEAKIAFSFIPLDDRKNDAYSTNAYRFHGELEGYFPSTTVIADCLAGIYQPSLVDIKALFNPAYNTDPLVEYGFYTEVTDENGKTDYEMNYDYLIVFDYNSEEYGMIRQSIMIMKAPNGNYYAYTQVYDPDTNEFLYSYNMIVEVSAHSFFFLEMESHHWIESLFFNTSIPFVDRITLDSPDYSAEFLLDNSASDQSNVDDSSKIIITGTEKYADGTESKINTFQELWFVDNNRIIWQITESNVRAFNSSYEEISIGENSCYDTKNVFGNKVRALNGYIECYDLTTGAAKIVKVSADEVSVKDVKSGETTVYARSGVSQFRRLYRSLLFNSIESSYEMTKEEEAALIANKDNWILTLTVRIQGKDVEYSFYYLSPRKAYLTINGNGGFYVHIGRAEKNISDFQNFFNGVLVDYNADR